MVKCESWNAQKHSGAEIKADYLQPPMQLFGTEPEAHESASERNASRILTR